MGACETTPSASTGNTHADPLHNPIRNRIFLALEDLPPLAGIKLVRPRRCAAAGAPACPWPRGGKTGATARKLQKNSQPSPAARVVTGSASYALLTMVALMGDPRMARARSGAI